MSAPQRRERNARERLERVLYLACGIGAVVFGGLLAGGSGGIVAQYSQLAAWYAPTVVAIAVLIPSLLVLFAYTLPVRVLRVTAGSVALIFVALQLAWVPAMTVSVLSAPPWLQGINALHATIIALVWQRRWVWLYPIAQGPIVAVTQIASVEGSIRAAVLDGLGAMVFCLILMGVAMAVLSAADRQDSAAARARRQASLEASRRTREREQSRINAIVHDDIMSVLLAASRDTGPEQLARQATIALKSVTQLNQDQDVSREYSPEETVAVLRNAVSDLAPGVEFTYDLDGGDTIGADVVAALSEALAEATRNSILHAGDVARSVDVAVTDGAVTVVARDAGPGFSMRQVSERRLGIRVSIIERMRSLPGGDARVSARPGRGTVVTLMWRRA